MKDDSEGGYEAYGDHFLGIIFPLLVTQPCLSQSHKIFRSRCEIEGKICDMIMDSGSVKNYIASNVVEKLGLPVKPHTHPYYVG